ncbi:chymotrypsin-like serine proteinase [Argopecten irradians]|uniref:chymotrypsin-like serine proteinase n=1 Tax=Argopecten irradians TaxID=31199 RepID=UPI0037111FF9
MFSECSVQSAVPAHFNEDRIQQTASYGMGRVIGGEDSEICEYPWQASLMFNGRHICGAVAIGDKVALTAAHCVSWAPASNFSIRVGSTSSLRAGLTFQVAETVVAMTMDYAHQRCDISGWGYTVYAQVLPEILQSAKMTVMSNDCCAGRYDVIGPDVISSGHVCIITKNTGSCNGDSGGPLTCGNTVIGITSFGIRGCLTQYPSVYSRVSYFREWIRENSGV